MVKIQIDLTEDEDRLVEIFKAENRVDTKENAVKEMIKRAGKCKHKYDMVGQKIVRTKAGEKETLLIQRCVYCGELKKDLI